jgi:hypothetical protein
VAISIKAEKIWSTHLFVINAIQGGLIEMLKELAEEIYIELRESGSYQLLLKTMSRDDFTEAIVGDILIGLLYKYKEIHPNMGNGAVKIDEKKLYELGALDPAIIS